MEYIVGIDLCRDFTQLCIFNNETNTVDSVALSSDRQSTKVKTAISYSASKKDFMVYSPLHDGKLDITVIPNLYDLAMSGEHITIDGEDYSSARILARFFRRIIACINRECEPKDIRGITVTVKDLDLGLKSNLEEALVYYGIPAERIKICDHIESFMYYVVMQNKDIWINDVGLMCFDEEGFKAYVLHFGRKQQPMSIVAETSDFSDSVKYSMLKEEDDIRIKYAFESVCGILLHKQNISAVYATGDGFDGTWADETLKRISTGRRIFKGQNLYVKAAACVAHLTFDGGSENYLIIGEDDLKSSIALRAVSGKTQKELAFGNVGQKYYEAGGSCELILDNTNEIDFMIHNALKKDSFCAIMTLDALPTRRNKTNRVSVNVRFPSRDCAVVTVKDVGFGAIRKTDYRIWEQVINL
jgi:hypothetical protein